MVTMFIQGCETTNFASSVDEYKSNKESTGLVLFSTTENTGQIHQVYSVAVKNINTNKNSVHIFRNRITKQSNDMSLFFGGLPSGEYKITKVTANLLAATLSLDLSTSTVNLTGNFIVKSGEIADLGRLIFTAVNTKVAFGRSKIIVDNKALVKQFFPEEKELNKPVYSGWLEAHKNIDIVEAFALSHPQGITSLSEKENGQIIAGTALGTTLIRANAGHWNVLSRNNNLHQIVATTSYDKDNYTAIVANEFGVFSKITTDGEIHDLDKGNLPQGGITFMSSSADYKIWFIAIVRNDYSELYQSNSIENGDWALVKKIKIGVDFWSGLQNAFYWRMPNGIGVAAGKNTTLSCYDYTNDKWIENSTPDKRNVISISASLVNESVGILTSAPGGFAGAFAKTHFSLDCGKTWLETDSPYTVKSSAPLLVDDNFIIETGGVFSDEGIYGSTDNGKNWYKISNESVLSNKLLLTKKHGLLSISNGSYGFENIKNSKDFGATWELELTSFNVSLRK